METERKHEIALQLYLLALKEGGIRFFPQKADKEISRISKLVPGVDPYHVRCFIAEVYADVIYKKLGVPQRTPLYMFSSTVAGKIALALLVDMNKEHGVKMDADDFRKRIGNAHKLTDISKEELREFCVETICNFFQGIKV